MVSTEETGPKRLRLGVLDQAPIPEGVSGPQALANAVDLARHADALGYHRYWVAEHHGTPGMACASPEALIGPIGAATSHIRVGSGGVMLPHYSPLKVAEVFSMFSGLFPGRVDLGLGRAPGTDMTTAFALQRDRRQVPPQDFPGQLRELLGYFRRDLAPDHPFVRLASVLPGGAEHPEPWLLGSSEDSAGWAAEAGMGYAFADFINPAAGPTAVSNYRWGFRPSADFPAPRVIVGVLALAAESDEEAERLASSEKMFFRLLIRGQLVPVPTVERALAFLAENPGPDPRITRPRRFIYGTPDKVKSQIEAVAADYGAEEAMVLTIMHDHAARKRSYALLAEAFGLQAPAVAAA